MQDQFNGLHPIKKPLLSKEGFFFMSLMWYWLYLEGPSLANWDGIMRVRNKALATIKEHSLFSEGDT